MKEPLQKIKELDGKQLYYSFMSGAQRIFENQKLLNKINVFPVQDADTGTNLASTMRSIMDAIIPTDNLKQTAVAIADAALIGARGNSGIIFAQFLYGFSNEIQGDQALDIRNFAESMKRAVNYAYEAIANPVEGTILTVIKDWAEYLDSLKDIIDDFIKLLGDAYEIAQRSLADTTKQLAVLTRNHVVDAGAKGFVVFLEGILDFFTTGGTVKAVDNSALVLQDEGAEAVVSHEVITFRYCTEALISGTNLDKSTILKNIKHCGDSLVLAGSPRKMRIHMHTDFPAELISILQGFGTISYQKVDDMVMQNEILHNKVSKIAILTESACDHPKEILDTYQIHVVPLTLPFGETYFLDRLTIQPQNFYSMLERTEHRPTSAQPAYKEFQNKYEYLCMQYDHVIGVNLTQAMSGTFFNSDKAGREVAERTGKQVKVFNSKTLTGGLGLILLRVARSIQQGVSYDELLPLIDQWIEKSHMRVTVPTLKYIVKSGRVSPFKGFVAKMLDLKPVILIDKEGAAQLSGKSFTIQGSMKNSLKNIRSILNKGRLWEYAITHAGNPDGASWYTSEMEKLTGKPPAFVEHASPALVANVGPGVVCVSLLME
ncbi:MAG: DegV family protein [Bacteroidota bacterium]